MILDKDSDKISSFPKSERVIFYKTILIVFEIWVHKRQKKTALTLHEYCLILLI